VVVYGDGERSFCALLPNHVLAENLVYLFWFWHCSRISKSGAVHIRCIVPDQIVAKLNAFQANAAVQAYDEFLNLLAGFSAKHTSVVASISGPGQICSPGRMPIVLLGG
jgi:hypothetical protein